MLRSYLKTGAVLHELHNFLTVAESLGGSGVVVGGGAGGGGGVAGSDAVSAPKETSPSPSSCGMAPIRSALSACRLDRLWALPLSLGGRGRWGRARNRPRAARRSRSDHILPGGGARAPHRSLSCRQQRRCRQRQKTENASQNTALGASSIKRISSDIRLLSLFSFFAGFA